MLEQCSLIIFYIHGKLLTLNLKAMHIIFYVASCFYIVNLSMYLKEMG